MLLTMSAQVNSVTMNSEMAASEARSLTEIFIKPSTEPDMFLFCSLSVSLEGVNRLTA